MYALKLVVQLRLEDACLGLCQCAAIKVKDLFREQPQDMHGVLTQVLGRLGSTHQLRDERWPFGRPVLLQDLQHETC